MSGDTSFDLLTKVASAAPLLKMEAPAKPKTAGLHRSSSVPARVSLQEDGHKIMPLSEPKIVSAPIKNDWHLFLTVEERNNIRSNIRAAYKRKTVTFEELLETCAAIEEELVFLSAPSRLDYFKAGIQYEKRVTEKRRQLSGDSSSMIMPSVVEPTSQPTLKRYRSAPSGGQSES